MTRYRWLELLTLILGVTTLFISACAPGPSPVTTVAPTSPKATEAEPKAGGTLTIALPGEPESLDGNFWRTDEEARVFLTLYNKLVRQAADGTLVPDLAKSWEVAEDNVTWTMELRQGVKFHDGTDFNAQAVKFSLDRLRSEELASPRRSLFDFLDRVEVVGDYTVKLITKEPLPAFLDWMAYPAAAIVSPAAAEKWGADFGQHPVGTGPFKFEEWVPGDRIVLSRHEDYWDGAPHLEKLIFKPVTEPATRVALLETGEVDMMMRVPPTELALLRDKDDIILTEPLGVLWVYFSLNTLKEPFNDVRVRQALNYAVDKQTLVEHILGSEYATVISGVAASGLRGMAVIEPEGWPYDPEKAKQLLTEAGYPDGFTAEMGVTQDRYLNDREMAQVVADQLSDVGIEVSVSDQEYAAYVNELNKQQFDIAELAWSGQPPVIDTIRPLFYSTAQPRFEGGYNRGGYENERVDELIDEASTTVDAQEWEALWKEAQEIIWEEAPHIWMYEVGQIHAYADSVKDLVILSTNGWMRFENAYKE